MLRMLHMLRMLWHAVACCGMLWHAVACCGMLWHAAACCAGMLRGMLWHMLDAAACSTGW